MKVTDHLRQAKRPIVTFEIIPPKRGGSLESLLSLVEELSAFHPPFIDITSHAAKPIEVHTDVGIVQKLRRRRPGTLGLCALIQHRFGIDAVPHVLCHGFSREETEDFLIELAYLGIDNILALRGDDGGFQKPLPSGCMPNGDACELISQTSALKQGKYLEGTEPAFPLPFCVGAACYPEKHKLSPSIDADVQNAKEKVEQGAEYLVTQMFFRNEHYFHFVRRCRDAGIQVPIIPGLKVLTRKRQLDVVAEVFACEIPDTLRSLILNAPDADVSRVGAKWTREQSQELLEGGAPSVHYYVMQSAKPVQEALQGIL